MSDYISKSALIEELQKRIGGDLDIEDVEYLEKVVNSIPTLDEKEIIRKPFERVVERLNEITFTENTKEYGRMDVVSLEDALNVVEEEGGIE